MAGSIFIVKKGPHGIVATHPGRLELPALVAPIDEDSLPDKFNTLRPPLLAIGCMRIYKDGFAFDSSMISPLAAEQFRDFADLMLNIQGRDAATPKRLAPCSVFGHADPTGTDEYNKQLSARRARSVYAVLVRDPEIWHQIYDAPLGNDDWHGRAVQQCLSVALAPVGNLSEPPFYSGPIDGMKTAQTTKDTNDAVQAYLAARHPGAPPSHTLTREQRKALFLEYMNTLCLDSHADPFIMDPKQDFLARGVDPDLRGDIQGCSEFNPILIQSQDDITEHTHGGKTDEAFNDVYVDDRRVLVFIFKIGTKVTPAAWPCPSFKAPGTACQKRFWSDADARRTPAPDHSRTFGKKMQILSVGDDGLLVTAELADTGNTMACRFYHGLAQRSPCEAGLKEWVVRFLVDRAPVAPAPHKPLLYLTGRRYAVHIGEEEDAAVVRGVLDNFGEIRIPVLDEVTKITIKLDTYGLQKKPDDPDKRDPQQPGPSSSQHADEKGFDSDRFRDEDFFFTYVLDGGGLKAFDQTADDTVKQRLYNLGFGETGPDTWTDDQFQKAMAGYRRRKGLDDTVDDATVRGMIRLDHEVSDIAEATGQSGDPGAPPPTDDASKAPGSGGPGSDSSGSSGGADPGGGSGNGSGDGSGDGGPSGGSDGASDPGASDDGGGDAAPEDDAGAGGSEPRTGDGSGGSEAGDADATQDDA